MPGLKHFPDKPIERGPEDLADLDNGDYICQQKSDGWRLEVCKTLKGKTVLISRHNNVMNDQVEEPIRAEIERMLDIMPNRCQLDGEWLSRRQATNGKSEPRLILFDVVRYDGRWLLDEPYENRWSLLETLFDDLLDTVTGKDDAIQHLSLAETAKPGRFVEFYKQQKQLAHSEGVVVKHRLSTLIGNRKECKDNPRWMKVRYRAASDGNMTMDHLRSIKKTW